MLSSILNVADRVEWKAQTKELSFKWLGAVMQNVLEIWKVTIGADLVWFDFTAYQPL